MSGSPKTDANHKVATVIVAWCAPVLHKVHVLYLTDEHHPEIKEAYLYCRSASLPQV